MSRELAHQLLDDAKAGKEVHPDLIYRALQATGDIAHQFPSAKDEE
jgi:hypothetical protein